MAYFFPMGLLTGLPGPNPSRLGLPTKLSKSIALMLLPSDLKWFSIVCKTDFHSLPKEPKLSAVWPRCSHACTFCYCLSWKSQIPLPLIHYMASCCIPCMQPAQCIYKHFPGIFSFLYPCIPHLDCPFPSPHVQSQSEGHPLPLAMGR